MTQVTYYGLPFTVNTSIDKASTKTLTKTEQKSTKQKNFLGTAICYLAEMIIIGRLPVELVFIECVFS